MEENWSYAAILVSLNLVLSAQSEPTVTGKGWNIPQMDILAGDNLGAVCLQVESALAKASPRPWKPCVEILSRTMQLLIVQKRHQLVRCISGQHKARWPF
jgi:hypothetical protein